MDLDAILLSEINELHNKYVTLKYKTEEINLNYLSGIDS